MKPKFIQIGETEKRFSLREVQALFSLVKSITFTHHARLEPIRYKLDRMLSNDPRRALSEKLFDAEVRKWKRKINKLGALASSLWVVEFDMGGAMISWRFPELSISRVRLIDETFGQRRCLSRFIEEYDPDWAHF